MVLDQHTDAGVRLASVAWSARHESVPANGVDSWQFYLVKVAHDLRDTVENDPAALLTLVQPQHLAHWTRPVIGNVDPAEAFLSAMVEYGFSDEDAAAIYLTFFTRILGVLYAQAAVLTRPARTVTLVDAVAYPTLARLGPMLARNTNREEFDAAVDDIISGLERDLRDPGFRR